MNLNLHSCLSEFLTYSSISKQYFPIVPEEIFEMKDDNGFCKKNSIEQEKHT